MEKFAWLKVYFSPFKPIIPKLYIGKIAIGTPYFLPRKWIKRRDGYLEAIPRKIGFDFVGLGWKSKWRIDYRYEWSPIWSFVFFKWQVAIIFTPDEVDHYWTCWLYYSRDTDKRQEVEKRIQQGRVGFPCIWRRSVSGKEDEVICYWDKILKPEYR
jgi:hypothetical protein